MPSASPCVSKAQAWERRADVAHLRWLLAHGWPLTLIADTYCLPSELIADLVLEGY